MVEREGEGSGGCNIQLDGSDHSSLLTHACKYSRVFVSTTLHLDLTIDHIYSINKTPRPLSLVVSLKPYHNSSCSTYISWGKSRVCPNLPPSQLPLKFSSVHPTGPEWHNKALFKFVLCF